MEDRDRATHAVRFNCLAHLARALRSMKKSTGLIILNPLRNREPERVASQFLFDLRNGMCNADESTVPELCKAALERRPVLDLKLRNRRDTGNAVVLFYKLKGKFRPDRDIDPEDAWGQGMIQVQRIGSEWFTLLTPGMVAEDRRYHKVAPSIRLLHVN